MFHQLIVLEEIVDQAIKHYTLNVRSRGKQLVLFSQCLQILFMSRVTMTPPIPILLVIFFLGFFFKYPADRPNIRKRIRR